MSRLLPCLLVSTALASTAAASQEDTRIITLDGRGNRTATQNAVTTTSPSILDLRPRRVVAGDRVNIYGENFPPGIPTTAAVLFGTTPGTVVAASSRVLTVEVPSGVASGAVTVSFGGGAALDAGAFAVEGVVLTPADVAVDYGDMVQFMATVEGATSNVVQWAVNGINGGNNSVGTIDTSGLYMAPLPQSAAGFPYVVSAYSAELDATAYSLVTPACRTSAPLTDDTFTTGAFTTSYERDCYTIDVAAYERLFVAYVGTTEARSLTLRDPQGQTIRQVTGNATTLRLADQVITEAGTYRIEVEGTASSFGTYKVWADKHAQYGDGLWLLPTDGDWDVADNWSNGYLPGVFDNVVIPDLPDDVTVRVDTAGLEVLTVTSNETIQVTSGSLTVNGQLSSTVPVLLTGGQLIGATVNSGLSQPAVVVAGPGGLTDATVIGDIRVDGGGSLYVRGNNGLTLNGDVDLVALGGASYLYFAGYTRLGGNGTIRMGSAESTDGKAFFASGSNAELTIGAGVRVEGDGSIGSTSAGLVNHGTVVARRAGSRITMIGDEWRNLGTVEAEPGTTVRLQGMQWSNEGTLTAGTNGSIELRDTYSNSGTVSVTGGRLDLGGNFELNDLGTLTVDAASSVEITGTMRNSTLDLGAWAATWILKSSGMVEDSTLDGPGSSLRVEGAGRIHGGAIVCDLRLANNAQMRLQDTVQLDGTIWYEPLANTTYMYWDGDVSLVGGGEIRMQQPSSGASYFYPVNNSSNLDIGPSIRIVGQGRIGSGGVGPQLIARGDIRAQGFGATLRINQPSWRNLGTVTAGSGASLELDGNGWSNEGAIFAEAGSRLDLDGVGYMNTGSITATDALVELDGEFSLGGLGGFTASGAGRVDILGRMQNSTLDLAASPVQWRLVAGELETCVLEGVGRVFETYGTCELDGVTSRANIGIQPSSFVYLRGGGLTLDGSEVRVDATSSSAYLYFGDGQTIAGTGTVVLTGSASAARLQPISGTSMLTLAPGITVTGTGYVGARTTGMIRNEGVIRSVGGEMRVMGPGSVNVGLVESSRGSTLLMLGVGWSNTGQITGRQNSTMSFYDSFTNTGAIDIEAGGVLELRADSQLTDLGSLSVAATGRVDIYGTVRNSTLDTNVTNGSWHLRNGGTLLDSTLSNGMLNAYAGSIVDNCVVAAPAVLQVVNAQYTRIRNGIQVDGTVNLRAQNSSSTLYYEGAQTISGSGQILMGPGGSAGISSWTNTMELVIGPSITVRGRGTIGSTSYPIRIQGTCTTANPGDSLTISGSPLTNDGDIAAVAGSTLRVRGSSASSGTITLTDATLVLDTDDTVADIGTIVSDIDSEVQVTGVVRDSTLDLSTSPGKWRLVGGRFRNMTVTNGTLLSSTGYLESSVVTPTGIVEMVQGGWVRIDQTVTLNGVMNFTNTGTSGQIYMFDGAVLGGTGEVVLRTPSYTMPHWSGTGSMTLDTGLTVRGVGRVGSVSASTVMTNRASIEANVAGGTLIVGAGTWTNEGALVASGGARLRIGGTVTNTGSIDVTGSTLELDGETSLAALTQSGTLAADATSNVDITDDWLGPLDPTITASDWTLRNGTLMGSTVTAGTLIVDGSALAESLVVANGATVECVGGSLQLVNGAQVDGTLVMNNRTVYVHGDETIDGSGLVTLAGGAIYGWFTNDETTIGQNLTVTGRGNLGTTSYRFVNSGTVRIDVSGFSSLRANAQGAWRQTATGQLEILNGASVSAGSGLVMNGTVMVDASSSLGVTGAYVQQSGSFELFSGSMSATSIDVQAGVFDAAGSISSALNNDGTLRIAGAGVGQLTLSGPFTQGPGGSLEADLGGPNAGQYDRLISNSGATGLGGELALTGVSGYVGQVGHMLDVVMFSSQSGACFNSVSSSGLGGLTPQVNCGAAAATVSFL